MTITFRSDSGCITLRQLLGLAGVLLVLGALVTPLQWYLATRHLRRTEPARRRRARRMAARRNMHQRFVETGGYA